MWQRHWGGSADLYGGTEQWIPDGQGGSVLIVDATTHVSSTFGDKLQKSTAKEIVRIVNERKVDHQKNLEPVKEVSKHFLNNVAGRKNETRIPSEQKETVAPPSDELVVRVIAEYQRAEWESEAKTAKMFVEDLDPIELDSMLRIVAKRTPFLAHPLAKIRLKLNGGQSDNLRTLHRFRAAIAHKEIEKNRMEKTLPKTLDFGKEYSVTTGRMMAQLNAEQLMDYLELIGAIDEHTSATEYFKSLTNGEIILKHFKHLLGNKQ